MGHIGEHVALDDPADALLAKIGLAVVTLGPVEVERRAEEVGVGLEVALGGVGHEVALGGVGQGALGDAEEVGQRALRDVELVGLLVGVLLKRARNNCFANGHGLDVVANINRLDDGRTPGLTLLEL